MTTWLDHSRSGVVVGCRSCPSWRVSRPTTAAGWIAAADHAARVHGPTSAEARHAHKNLSRRVTGDQSTEDGPR